MQRFQAYNFDEFEYGLMAVMTLMSPDRGGQMDVAERRALDNIQECLAAILEIKQQKDGKDVRYFAACMALLARLRSFSESVASTWNQIIITQ